MHAARYVCSHCAPSSSAASRSASGSCAQSGSQLAFVRPTGLRPCRETAEGRAQLAGRRVQAEADRLEPDRRGERRHLLGIVRRVWQPGARFHHRVVIGRHCTSQSSRPSQQNSTSTGRSKPRSAARTSCCDALGLVVAKCAERSSCAGPHAAAGNPVAVGRGRPRDDGLASTERALDEDLVASVDGVARERDAGPRGLHLVAG